MLRFDNVRVTCRTLWFCGVVMSVTMAAPAAPGPSDTPGSSEPGAASKRHPLVVQKQAEIRGRVFFLPDEGEGIAVAAGKLAISVYDREGRKQLHATVADDDGAFTLPDLAVGVYQIKLGSLTLELSVEVREESGKRQIPKTLLVFMPRDLEKQGEKS